MATAARKTNWFAIWVSVAAVAALVGVGAVVVTLNNAATAPGTPPEASNIDTGTGAIRVGDGPDTLATYVDFMCPVCGDFEAAFGGTIDALVAEGTIALDIHPVSILDRASQGTEYSTRAANAMYCVAESDADAALPFLQALFANQPPEPSSGLTDEQILELSSAAGVTGIEDCVGDVRYERFVAAMTAETPLQPGQQAAATPTIAVNGETIANSDLPADPADLMTLFS